MFGLMQLFYLACRFAMLGVVEDMTPALQALAAARVAHSFERWSDAVDTYIDDAHRDFLLERGKLNYADATAVRHVEESGSGRVRVLDASNTAPAKAA